MQLNCVLGENFCDVAARQFSLIGEGLSLKRKQVVVTPSQYVSIVEYDILKALNLTATFDITVVDFSGLVDKFCPLGFTKKLSSLASAMVQEKIITENEDSLTCFKNTAKTIAFSNVINDTIVKLKSCKITPSDLRSAISKLSNPALQSKLNDLLLIYENYENFLGKGYADTNSRLSNLVESLKQNPELKNTDFHFCYFDAFTKNEFSVIEELSLLANSVSVGGLKSGDNQNNKDCYTTDIFEGCVALSKKIQTNFLQATNSLNKESTHILHNAMAISPEKMEVIDASKVRLFSANSTSGEVEFAAKDIIFKIQNGARFKDFVIYVGDMATYAPIISHEFNKYNIPFFANNQFKLGDSEGAKFVLAALDCVEDGFQIVDVLRYAKNSLAGLSAHDYAVFENVIRRYGLSGERLKDDSRPENDDDEFDKYLEIKAFLTPLFNLYENLKKSETASDMVGELRKFFDVTSLRENLFGMALSFQERGEMQKCNIARQNFDKINNILEQMLEIFGNDRFKTGQFFKIFKSGVANVGFSSNIMSADCVLIEQALTGVMRRLKFCYILGAVEGSMPSWCSDVGLISDYDIIDLKNVGLNLSPSAKQQNAINKFRVLQNLALSEEQLTLFYPLTMAGEDCKPASIVDEISKIFKFNGAKIPVVSIEFMLKDDNAFGGTKERLGFLWKTPTDIVNGVVEALQDENCKLDNTILASAVAALKKKGLNSLWDEISQFLNNQKGVAKLSDSASVFFTEGKARVTQIEKFFECPYAHFLTYGVRLQQQKTSKPEAVDVGNILHAVFEKFGYIIRKKLLSEDEIEEIVPQIFDEILKRKEFSHITFSGRNEMMLKNLKTEAVRACKAINYQLLHSEYKIKFIETSFGQEGFARVPEVAVVNINHTIKISGKIDRADLWGSKLRIIDYKTSKHSGNFSLLNFYLGKKIQLFYYMQAIVKDLGLGAGGAYYLPVHREYLDEGATKYSSFKLDGVSLYTEANMFAQDGQVSLDNPTSDIVDFGIKTSAAHKDNGIIELRSTASAKTKSATEEQFSALLEYARKVLEGAVLDICNGEISPLYIGGACEFCPYSTICRKDILPSAKERRADYNVDLDSFKLGEENE